MKTPSNLHCTETYSKYIMMTTQNYKQKIITHLTESTKIVHFIGLLFLWILHSIKC